MKKYNPETHFLMPNEVSTAFQWFRFVLEQMTVLIILLGILLILLWSLLQILMVLVELASLIV
jgi:hypothetical protein